MAWWLEQGEGSFWVLAPTLLHTSRCSGNGSNEMTGSQCGNENLGLVTTSLGEVGGAPPLGSRKLTLSGKVCVVLEQSGMVTAIIKTVLGVTVQLTTLQPRHWATHLESKVTFWGACGLSSLFVQPQGPLGSCCKCRWAWSGVVVTSLGAEGVRA